MIHTYPILIKETNLDVYGHVNNSTYLTLFEEARWDLITKQGYGLEQIKKSGIGPIILEVHIKYYKELLLRDEIIIETSAISYEKKIGKLLQKMVREEEVCCEALFVMGLFDLKNRKLINPTPEWLQVIGYDI
ncbi:Long-chain acyl-CoA thioesterase FadM [Candidatus Rubidus massiliensis]|nr:Long-chain acyl-CoA thioesterase FadM [Candidatus Rubidus massiliensis]